MNQDHYDAISGKKPASDSAPPTAKRSASKPRSMLPPKKRKSVVSPSQVDSDAPAATLVPPPISATGPSPPPIRAPQRKRVAPAPSKQALPPPKRATGASKLDAYKIHGKHWKKVTDSSWKKVQIHGNHSRNLFIQEYIRTFGCMICGSINGGKAGIHRKALTEDGKLLVVCSKCRTSVHRSMDKLDADLMDTLVAQWRAEMLNEASATPCPSC